MGFLSKIFNKKEDPLKKIAREIWKLIENENYQNSLLSDLIRTKVITGTNVDEISGATGHFGFDLNNPIPVNGGFGELAYLSRLETDQGEQLLFHRIGSINTIDVFEAVTFSGSSWYILFMDLYHPRRSKIAPKGFRIALSPKQFSGFTNYCPNFPYDFTENKEAQRDNGLLIAYIPSNNILAQIKNQVFKRSVAHKEKIKIIKNKLTSLQVNKHNNNDNINIKTIKKFRDEAELDSHYKRESPKAYKTLNLRDPLTGKLFDNHQVLSWIVAHAEKEDSNFQCILGLMYNFGSGVPQNYDKAEFWLSKSMGQGLVCAQTYLGECYFGQGVELNQENDEGFFKKAISCYEQAGEQGDLWAQILVAEALSNGLGVKENQSRAEYWEKKAENQDDEYQDDGYKDERHIHALVTTSVKVAADTHSTKLFLEEVGLPYSELKKVHFPKRILSLFVITITIKMTARPSISERMVNKIQKDIDEYDRVFSTLPSYIKNQYEKLIQIHFSSYLKIEEEARNSDAEDKLNLLCEELSKEFAVFCGEANNEKYIEIGRKTFDLCHFPLREKIPEYNLY